MRRDCVTTLLIALLFLGALLAARPVDAADSPQTGFRFHLVHRLHVQPINNAVEVELIDKALARELALFGFEVVPRSESADATLVIDWAVVVVADGGPKDYPENIFQIVLVDNASRPLWKGKVSVLESRRERRTVDYQARAIARKLEKAWHDSARKWKSTSPLRRQPN
jgi:hypothetical protein